MHMNHLKDIFSPAENRLVRFRRVGPQVGEDEAADGARDDLRSVDAHRHEDHRGRILHNLKKEQTVQFRHRRFIYEGDTSTLAEGTDPRGGLSERGRVRRHYGPLYVSG